jgi:hypothetical protein
MYHCRLCPTRECFYFCRELYFLPVSLICINAWDDRLVCAVGILTVQSLISHGKWDNSGDVQNARSREDTDWMRTVKRRNRKDEKPRDNSWNRDALDTFYFTVVLSVCVWRENLWILTWKRCRIPRLVALKRIRRHWSFTFTPVNGYRAN